MRVDTTKIKKGSTELTPECYQLINEISQCTDSTELLKYLEKVKVWVYGKCELYHWIKILDRFDEILHVAAKRLNGNEYMLQCDVSFLEHDVRLLLAVLYFTTLLIEHSFSRHLYNSIEYLTELLSSENMDIVLAVLNLLYMFSKRSNFIPRLSHTKKDILLQKLFNIAERWGDPNNGLALIDCCLKTPKYEFLYQMLVEYINDTGQRVVLEIPNMKPLCDNYSTSEIVKILCDCMPQRSEEIKMRIEHRVRLVSGFRNKKTRLQFVQARLQAISVLIYSNALQDNIDKILYTGFGEELCELIDRQEDYLVDIRAAILRTLTSMLHFDRNPNIPWPGTRLSKIIYYTGAERQTGMLPILVKDCISKLTGDIENKQYPLALATSLFSLLYHLASYESGGQALIKSGMMQTLLRVIGWTGVDLEHIIFVTRAVRVIDLITNIDIATFHQSNGINVFIDRLEKEVSTCRDLIAKECNNLNSSNVSTELNTNASDSNIKNCDTELKVINSNTKRSCLESYRYSKPVKDFKLRNTNANSKKKIACVTQRAALLKSILNFIKKSIQDHAHVNGTRNIMETSLPNSLHHIIFNAEFYGPSLFLLATDVITVYVFNEPSLLSSLQDSGLTKIILQSLLDKEVPATREVLASLPNVFSALCLNERGLMEFMSHNPFDKLLRVLLSPEYLVAMRRRRSSDHLGDTARNLGNAMDDLMKHHPYLRTDATEAVVRLLNELVRLGTDARYTCWRVNKETTNTYNYNRFNLNCEANIASSENDDNVNGPPDAPDGNENDSSDDDDEDDDELSSVSQQQSNQNKIDDPCSLPGVSAKPFEREPIPLIDYILNVMKFIEAIFSNSSNRENCREFILHGGLHPLLQLLSLPNLPIDSPVSTTALAVANVAKSIFNLSHETKVLETSLQQLLQITNQLEPLIKDFNFPKGSILFRELFSCPNIKEAFSNVEYTPLLHKMSAVHGYVVMLVHLCRNASNGLRLTLLKQWGNKENAGLQLLENLVKLYISLVWESTILLSICSEETINQSALNFNLNLVTFPMEFAKRDEMNLEGSNEDEQKIEPQQYILKTKMKPEEQFRYTKCLLAASSRLGRTLAELFGTLVKLSVGTPQIRPRRLQDIVNNISLNKQPTPEANSIAHVLSSILVNSFCHEHLMPEPAAKLKLTFLICSVGFTGPMLFDDKRNAFHLMLSQFCQQNGVKAFFDMFYWTLSINSNYQFKNECDLTIENILENRSDDESDFPEGSGEFLYAWLQLLEKMVNPRGLLESPYIVSLQNEANVTQFEPIYYLIQVHNLAIHSIRRIWARKPMANYGVLMTTTIVSILKHIVKSHNFLKDQYCSRSQELNNDNSTINKNVDSQNEKEGSTLFRDNLKILTDMGFEKQQILESLRNTSSLEQAMDYLLNYSDDSHVRSIIGGAVQHPLIGSSVTPNKMDTVCDLSSSTSSTESKSSFTKACPQSNEIFLIADDVFNRFCEDVVVKVFQIMENIPDIINLGAELMFVLYRRNSPQVKRLFVEKLVCELKLSSDNFTKGISQMQIADELKIDYINGPKASKLFTRIKVFTMLLEEKYNEFRKEFCRSMVDNDGLNSLVSLLSCTEALLTYHAQYGLNKKIPVWLQHLIEFIESIDNVMVILQRKTNTRILTSEIWKWYDVSTGKWNVYSDINNVAIKNAFNNGERVININIGRQRYTINFNCMTQVSESYGSHRPISPSLKLTDFITMIINDRSNTAFDSLCIHTMVSKADGTVEQTHENLPMKSLLNINDTSGADKIDGKQLSIGSEDVNIDDKDNVAKKLGSSSKPVNSQRKKHFNIVLNEENVGLAKLDNHSLIGSLVRLLHLSPQVHFDTQLAILKLCARLTKNYKNAEVFYKNGGLKILLKMRQPCDSMVFPIYSIVIMRHLLEVPKVLQDVFERVLISKASQHVQLARRDLTYVLTQLSSAVSRNPNLFLNTAKQALECENTLNSKFIIDHSKFLIRAVSNKKSDGIETHLDENSLYQLPVKVIKEVLRALAQPCIHYGSSGSSGSSGNQDSSDNVKTGDVYAMKTDESQFKEEIKCEPCCCSWHIPCTGRMHQKPYISRATLLKFLSDSVRSYPSFVPRTLVYHIYTPKDSTLVKQDQSFISFILEQFLPIVRPTQNSEVSMMTRVLISSLSDCYTQINVQTKLVDEIQATIARILAQPETPEKHTRLQVLTGLLPVMIDSPLLSYKNYMFEILIRRGVMTTLIKIAQCTDLSNQKTISTIQSILRPIDILLRISVSPVAVSSQNMRFIPFETSITNHHRFHPRINRSIYSNSNEDDITLRNIIRSVFSERRQAFDFIFNNDDLFLSGADTHGVIGANNDNDADESNIIDSFNNEYELDFDRLWDDLLQNENLRTFAENITDRSVSENIGSINTSATFGADNDRVDNDNGTANINSAGAGSDGTSTPSESTPVILDNRSCLAGDVSTSETDSDSNMSTENEDNNHDDDEEDDDEENDEPAGVQLEAGSSGNRQYLEVFDHVYVPESPETASNDPDIDAEEDGSYMGAISAVMSQDDSSHNNTSSTFITCSTSSSSVEQQPSANSNFIATEQNPAELRRSTTTHATTTSANNTANVNRFTSALTPYLQFVEAEDRQTFRPNMDANPNGVPDVGTTNYGRENTRRLLFLDQQYCAQVPTFNNPTEEGQVELFTQDALHWWLEEAKYFDPDSQVDACLYVGHFLMLNLLNKVKEAVNKKKVEVKPKLECKKSSIPILIQAAKNSTSSTSSLDADNLQEQEQSSEDVVFPEAIVDNAESSSITEEETEENAEDDSITLNMSISEESVISSNAEHNSNESIEENTNSESNSGNTVASASALINQGNIDEHEQEQLAEETSNPAVTSMDVTNPTDTTNSGENSKDMTETLQDTATAVIDNPNIADVASESVNRTNVPTTTSREEMTPEIREALGDLEIPDGVDPSFLAALPPELREEVIQEHLRMQRVDQTPQQSEPQTATQYPLTEVSPEFLAALPPNIQTEVLMQQRIEQQRRTAQSANPEDPVDTAAFFQNLPEALRQAILTDMEDSQMASLPPELAAEAQHLRRDWETRNGRRLDIQANSLNGYLSTRLPSSTHSLVGDESRWPSNAVWCDHTGINSTRHRHTSIIHQQQNYGKPLALLLMEDMNNLLDPDSLSTLLLFLFIEDNKFSCSRLHAIIRNICYHAPTRFWIINALMNIIRKADNPYLQSTQQQAIQPKWLKLKVDAAFGFKSNTFVIYKANGNNAITINPQASQQIVKNCLDLLFVLAKQFPRSFLPTFADKKSKKGNTVIKLKKELNANSNSLLSNPIQSTNICGGRFDEGKALDETPSTSKAIINKKPSNTLPNSKELRTDINYITNSFEFWDVLLNIDNCSDLRSVHTSEFPCFTQPAWEWAASNCEFTSFNDSAFAKLLEMLSFKLIRRSPQLTDLLLKLLASLSSELPEEEPGARTADNKLSKTNTTDSTNITNSKEMQTDKDVDVKEIDSMEIMDKAIQNPKIYSKIFFHFKILIEVLTLKCGTTEGLENISKIILNICQCSQSSNVIFFQYLRLAVLGLAEVVQKEIKFLLDELQTCYKSDKFKFTSALQQKYSTFFPFNGIIQDRYTSQQIVISSTTDVEPACELQLSAIKHLLSPSSAQVYFLRTLKIFILIHNLLDTQWNYHKNKVYLSEFLPLDQLWMTISKCLISLAESKDEYAVLVLQPSVEAFFLIHASYDTNVNNKLSTSNLSSDESATDKSPKPKEDSNAQEKLKCDRQKFLQFAEKHRSVLNQILRQSAIHLSDGPFAVLVDHTRILDFDVKRKYFYTELERLDEGVRREENTVSVRRASVFEDSFRALYRLTPEEWKNRFYISFEDEEGQDAGGLLREWYIIISREIFNPMYALFCVSPGDRVTYMINPSSYANPNHLSYFKFVGRVIAKAVHDNKLLECYFTRAFYKHILGKQVKYTDMESQDYEFYKGLDYLMKNNISTLGYDLTFSTEVQEFGVTQIRDLIPNGRNITVTEENKFDYVQLVCQLKMSGSIRQQLDAFLEGFYDIIPKQLISIFNEQELELLISGLPDIDIEDLKANTEYHKYTSKSSQIQWFWRALRSFDQADRARFLQFVTGTSKVPLQGFGSLEGMNGIQKFQIHRDDRSTDRLPCAHTCFNQLDLPMYKTYEKLRCSLLKAIHECSEGFGFA